MFNITNKKQNTKKNQNPNPINTTKINKKKKKKKKEGGGRGGEKDNKYW